MGPSEPTWHMSHVQKRVLKFINFKVQKVQKRTYLIWLTPSPGSGMATEYMDMPQTMGPIFQQRISKGTAVSQSVQ